MQNKLIETVFHPYKWVHHFDRLIALSQGEDVYPVTVELDLVSFCNHRCGWCVDPAHYTSSLSVDFISRLLDELQELGVKGIVLKGGGEPTLHENFDLILTLVKKRGFEIGIVSNGSQLYVHAKTIAENSDYVRISLDGPTKTSHHAIHQSHDFNKIILGVQQLISLRNNLPIVGLSFTVTDESLLTQAVELAINLHVDYILFRPPFFEEVGRKNSMTINSKKALFQAFKSLQTQYQNSMKVLVDYWISDSEIEAFDGMPESPRRGVNSPKGVNGIEHAIQHCYASPLLAVITADQILYPCCNLRYLPDWEIGKIDYASGRTFKAWWNSEERKQLLEKIHCVNCIRHCTHPMSRYNEIIAYLKKEPFHSGFV